MSPIRGDLSLVEQGLPQRRLALHEGECVRRHAEPDEVGSREFDINLIPAGGDAVDLAHGVGTFHGDLVADLGHDRQLWLRSLFAGFCHAETYNSPVVNQKHRKSLAAVASAAVPHA